MTLKERRIAMGLTQQGLARLVGCSRNAVCLWERHNQRPSARYALALASALNCTVEDLLAEEQNQKGSDEMTVTEKEYIEYDKKYEISEHEFISAEIHTYNIPRDVREGIEDAIENFFGDVRLLLRKYDLV